MQVPLERSEAWSAPGCNDVKKVSAKHRNCGEVVIA
jgi:hypothetical protein